MIKVDLTFDIFNVDDVVYIIDYELIESSNKCSTCNGTGDIKIQDFDRYIKCPDCTKGVINKKQMVIKPVPYRVESLRATIEFLEDINEIDLVNHRKNIVYKVYGFPCSIYSKDIPHKAFFNNYEDTVKSINDENALRSYVAYFWRPDAEELYQKYFRFNKKGE